MGAENTYGINKRFAFVEQAIATACPKTILDVGCGAGTYLTHLIAKRFPAVHVVGIDSDALSIAFAQKSYSLPNHEFEMLDMLREDARFDMVIASEVIEHVKDPQEFLANFKSRLNPGGLLVLTLPNGYGPFEIMAFVETLLEVTGITTFLRGVSGRRRVQSVDERDTLAASPHINFFSFGKITTLFGACGLRVAKYQPRTFLCGWALDRLLRGKQVIEWNARVADSLPAFMNSDWMFILEQSEPLTYSGYQRGVYGRVRRFLSEWRVRHRGAPR